MKNLKVYILSFVAVIISLSLISLIYTFLAIDKKSYELALMQAKNSFQKDFIFKKWVATHDSMYSYVTNANQPSEFLAHIPNRDIVTDDGQKLTLMNPTASLREIMNELEELDGIKGKLTSLNPLNIINKPDAWEVKVLKAFNKGDYFQKHELVKLNGKDYMRYMKALKSKSECLKCHYIQDKSINSIRGGLSISIPMDNYYISSNLEKQRILISHIFALLFGMLVLYLVYKQLKKSFEREIKAQEEAEFHKQQLQDQDKLAQMGEMIGNIAHQWRQPLSAISTAASGMRIQKQLNMLNDENFEQFTSGIVENTQFLSETINTFTDYVKEKHDFQDVILQDRIAHVLKILHSTFEHHYIIIEEDIDYDNPIKISMVVGELSQVLMNILNNAKDLLEKKDDNEEKLIKVSLKAIDNIATITIEDNAGGIPKDIFPKIFDPYFTTKHQSQGTGLGLFMSREIIVKHLHGKLYAQNLEGGAKFTIELPIDQRYDQRRQKTHIVAKERRKKMRRKADKKDD